MMMIAAGREEGDLIAVTLSDFKTKNAGIKIERTFQIRNF
jgi:hypothetical protein